MKQYGIYFTNEYMDEILSELTTILNLRVEKEQVNGAINEENATSKGNILCIKDSENLIIIDCNNRDWIYPLVIICMDVYAEKIKEVLLKWDMLIREEYGQIKTEEIKDVYGKKDTLLNHIEKYYNIKLY